MEVKVIGVPVVEARLKALGQAGAPAMARGLYRGAQITMTDAKQRTPVDTGALRASGHVQPNTMEQAIRSDGVVEFTLGFGGPAGSGNLGETNAVNVGYAVFVHEGTRFYPGGPRPGGVGERKYLERAVDAKLPEVVRSVNQEMETAIRGAARGHQG